MQVIHEEDSNLATSGRGQVTTGRDPNMVYDTKRTAAFGMKGDHNMSQNSLGMNSLGMPGMPPGFDMSKMDPNMVAFMQQM